MSIPNQSADSLKAEPSTRNPSTPSGARKILRKLSSPPVFRLAVLSGVAIALAATAAVMWHKVVREQYFPKNFAPVVPGEIYRSAYLVPNAMKIVQRDYGIKTIVDLGGSEPGTPAYADEVETARRLGIQRHEFNFPGDGKGDPVAYARVLELIADESTHPVLVHCAAGAYRTTTVAMLYRHLFLREPLWEAAQASILRGYDPYEHPDHLAYLAENLAAVRQALGMSERSDEGLESPQKRN